MSQSFVDQVTLEYLLNKEMYNSHVNNKKAAQVNKEERKLYKKRVYHLFQNLITGADEPQDLLPDVKYTYNNFFNSCIHYLKAKDTNDLAQSEYKGFIFTEENEVITDVSVNEINQQENCLEADKIMLRTIKMPPEPCLDKPSSRKGKKILAPPFSKVDRNNINNIYEDTSQEK